MSAPGWLHGSPIGRLKNEVGEDVSTWLRYLSPSAMVLADPGSDGCMRKWSWQYVAGKKPDGTAAQTLGTQIHAELESYQKTGRKDLSALALAGLHMVPAPGDDLGVELEMSSEFSSTDPEIVLAVGEAFGYREAGDYDKADAILAAVGIVSASGVPIIGRIDCVHARGTNQGTEDPSQAIDPPGTIEVIDWKTSNNVERYAKTPAELARSIQMLAYGRWVLLKEPDVEHVRLSHGYFQTKGRAVTRKVSVLLTRAEIIRRWEYAAGIARRLVGAARETDPNNVEANKNACDSFGGCPHRSYCSAVPGLKGMFSKASGGLIKIRKKTTEMGFLDKLRNADKARDTLTVPPEFAAAWKAIVAAQDKVVEVEGKASKIGRPALGADAAKYVAAMEGKDLQGSGFAGWGAIGETMIRTIEDAVGIAGELADVPDGPATAAPTPEPVASKVTPLSPDAPSSDPAMASAGEENKDPIKPKAEKAPKAPKAPKVEKADKTETISKAAAPAPGFALFINCVPRVPHVNMNAALLALADQIAADMSKEIGEEVYDIRACEKKPLGFGGWKGVAAAHVDRLELPTDGNTITVDTRGSELLSVMAEALSKRASLVVVGI